MNLRSLSYAGSFSVFFGVPACLGFPEADCRDLRNCDPKNAAGFAGTPPSEGGDSGVGGTSSSSGETGNGGGGARGGGSGGLGGNGGTTGSGGVSGTSAEGGASGDAGAAGAGSCDRSQSPTVTPCLVDEAHAIFVTPEGDDTSPGTRAAPVRTLKKAQSLAHLGDKRVIACSATFPEPLSLTDATPLRLYGGFDCAQGAWTPGAAPTRIAPPEGPALQAVGATGELLLEDLEFIAPPAQMPGESSIAALAIATPGLFLRRVRLVAAPGQSAELPTIEEFPFGEQSPGRSADGLDGASARSCTCPAGDTTSGGRGGNGGPSPQAGEPGLPALGGGKGGVTGAPCASGGGADGGGQLGASPPTARSGVGASTLGDFSDPNLPWLPSAGQDGLDGKAGQGGGGGRGGSKGGGGGGACGGCGGRGGPGGAGGGASIALLSIDSEVTLEAAELVTADAGHAAHGAPGQAAQMGGPGGVQQLSACQGGDGGAGASGGSGGGGAGGLSVGIVYRGPAPRVFGSHFVLGEPGDGGTGALLNEAGDDGIAGVSRELLEL